MIKLFITTNNKYFFFLIFKTILVLINVFNQKSYILGERKQAVSGYIFK